MRIGAGAYGHSGGSRKISRERLPGADFPVFTHPAGSVHLDGTSPVLKAFPPTCRVVIMPRMQTYVGRDSVVLGPCPGCEMWTLEYDREASAAYRYPQGHFAGVIEEILREHLNECPGLREIVYNTL